MSSDSTHAQPTNPEPPKTPPGAPASGRPSFPTLPSLPSSQLIRLLLIGFLILLLQIPMLMVRDVIRERQAERQNAIGEINRSWGQSQIVEGPRLVVPYEFTWVETRVDKDIIHTETRYAHFLPETLDIRGDLKSESRYRGIFEVPVYRTELHFKGEFAAPDLQGFVAGELKDTNAQSSSPQRSSAPNNILWDQAHIVVMASDARAIQNAAQLNWQGETFEFLPGTGPAPDPGGHAGFHVPVGDAAQEAAAFEFTLALQGSNALRLAPFAKTTRVELGSDWPDPSFQGAWLPTTRDISDQGFSAVWEIPFLGRSYPQRWNDMPRIRDSIQRSYFGVDLATMVDEYRMAERSAKYALLFLGLTFGTLWLFEVVAGIRIHSIQYLFVGGAMCLFYLLELALAEHLGFALAYALASTAVVGLVTAYCLAILGARRRAFAMGGVLVALYGYLFILLRNQDFALVSGSVGLFVALAAAMYLTRHIRWNEPRLPSA
ncbi:MAG: cell envelope integrity protein CreD [Myxococcota bacterium]